MFDYHQRPTTDEYRDGWGKVFGYNTDVIVFVRNPRTKKYNKINKTKGFIVEYNLDKPDEGGRVVLTSNWGSL